MSLKFDCDFNFVAENQYFMKYSFIYLLTFVLAIYEVGCGAHSPKHGHGIVAPHWTYDGEEGAEHWSNLCQDFRNCSEGLHQSPIDIETVQLKEVFSYGLNFRYHASNVDVVNNGHTIEVDVDEKNELLVEDRIFELKQFHFHEPAEHRLDGVLFPMEMHLVHVDTSGRLAVVGIFIKEGYPNPTLDEIWQQLPEKPEHHEHVGHPIELTKLFPMGHSFFHYEGSLTTPPCTEGVQWFILKEPLTLSKGQIGKFVKLYHGNSRPPQAINNRTIETTTN
jgi:carbonic anhydrase